VLNAEQCIEIINKALKLSLDPVTTPRDIDFKALGIDSLDFFSVLTELESITGREIADEDIQELTNIHSIVSYFNNNK
jgi:acyl carrier protein